MPRSRAALRPLPRNTQPPFLRRPRAVDPAESTSVPDRTSPARPPRSPAREPPAAPSAPTDANLPPLLLVHGATGGAAERLAPSRFARDRHALPPDLAAHASLQERAANLADWRAVTPALERATCAVCVAGRRPLSRESGMRRGGAAAVEARPRYGVARFLSHAGAFSPVPGDKLPVKTTLLRAVVGGVMRARSVLEDDDAAIATLVNSKDVQWVVVRPGFVNEGPTKGKLKETPNGGASVMYVDLAEFNLDAAQTKQFDGRAVSMAY